MLFMTQVCCSVSPSRVEMIEFRGTFEQWLCNISVCVESSFNVLCAGISAWKTHLVKTYRLRRTKPVLVRNSPLHRTGDYGGQLGWNKSRFLTQETAVCVPGETKSQHWCHIKVMKPQSISNFTELGVYDEGPVRLLLVRCSSQVVLETFLGASLHFTCTKDVTYISMLTLDEVHTGGVEVSWHSLWSYY